MTTNGFTIIIGGQPHMEVGQWVASMGIMEDKTLMHLNVYVSVMES